jgi:hypothetical protein
MRITVEVLGSLRSSLKGYKGPMVLDLPDGSTVAVAARAVGINENHEWNASVRGRFATSKDLVQDGDRLLLFDAIGGG